MTAVMSDQSNTNVAEFFSPGPGERLRAARLSMGYDLAKIASELHLTSTVVEALEADDFPNVGARVFVRGYLRNYARVVGMPVESVLRQFDEKWPDDAAHQSMVRESPTLPADGGPSRGLAGFMTWFLVLGLIVLFLMWWRGYLDEIVPEQIRSSSMVGDPATSVGMAPEEDTLTPLPLDEGLMLEDGGLRLPSRSLEEPVGTEQAVAETATPILTTETGPGEQPQAAAAEAVALPGQDRAASQVESEPAQAPESVASASGDQGAPVVDGTKQIVMTFTAPCWVDVRDSERKFKLFGEVPKGSRKVLGGQPPYKVVIGNAGAVSITVNGKPFDLAPYAKGNVARFTLDP